MNINNFKLVSNEGREITGEWHLDYYSKLHLKILDEAFEIPVNDNLEQSLERFFFDYNYDRYTTYKLKACVTCKNMDISGMAGDMARSQIGTCALTLKKAQLCELCDKYENNGQWMENYIW